MLAQFGLELIAGISLMWCLMPRAQVTAGFFRIQMLLVLGLSVLVALVMGWAESLPDLSVDTRFLSVVATIMAVCAFFGSVVWTLDRRTPGNLLVFGLFALSALALAHMPVGKPVWLSMLSSFVTAATLGGAVTGMLLGHWYLTAPTMSITPLKQLTWLFLAAVVARLVVSGISWHLYGAGLHGSLPWTWFALRWLAGILGPLVLCGMTLRILRYRNTQAATGVLFAAVILVFIGEMSATLLLGELQRPF